MESFFYDDDDDDDVFVFEIYLKLKFNEQLLSYDDVGRGEQHGEAGDDGEQGVDDQAEPVNHLDRQLHGKLLSVMENKYSSLPSCKSNLSGMHGGAGKSKP